MIASLKQYLYIGLGLLVTGLLVTVKILAGRNSRLSTKLERSQAKIHHAKVVEQKKVETTIELKSRKADLVNELKEKKTSSELSDPDENW